MEASVVPENKSNVGQDNQDPKVEMEESGVPEDNSNTEIFNMLSLLCGDTEDDANLTTQVPLFETNTLDLNENQDDLC
jgi:hypothetical protein